MDSERVNYTLIVLTTVVNESICCACLEPAFYSLHYLTTKLTSDHEFAKFYTANFMLLKVSKACKHHGIFLLTTAAVVVLYSVVNS